MTFTIRKITDLTSALHFQELQRRVWGSPPIDIMPIHISITVIKNGGMLLGAYAEDGPEEMAGMIGGVFWWLGVSPDPEDPPGSAPKLKACSHMVGVLPQWQRHGIGLQLKLAQRRAILDQGLTDWVTWTYDPLYRRNAVFNIRRLGATSCIFDRDVYGELPDALNAGWPSDRLTVDWRLNSPRVLRDIDSPRPKPEWDPTGMDIPTVRENKDGFPEPPDVEPVPDGRVQALPLPADMDGIRDQDADLSMAWRLYMRHALEIVFAAGYTVVDCVHLPDYGWRYILIQDRQ
jgi:predicted GNAT superfamily acetyltransferase